VLAQTTPSAADGTYHDREHAGRLLARELSQYKAESPLVIAIPRGGVPVAATVARELQAELDIMVVRKLRVPGHEEVVGGATHLFEEPGKLQEVAALAIQFFQEKLVTRDAQRD
jgi:predicted phosphoribosyltransferase